MELINGEKKLAGAKSGDTIQIVFLDMSVARIVLNSYDKVGVEGFVTTQSNSPLEMYPWTSIKKVRKDNI